MKPDVCPICDSAELELLYAAARDYITGENFQVWRCGQCGLGFTYPRPENMDAYYPAAYRRYRRPAMAVLKAIYRLRARSWGRAFAGAGAALEPGCGDGLMLGALHDRGWRVVGTERTVSAASFARHHLNLPVFAGGLEALRPEPTFDLIILFQVLEHLPDPLRTLKQCARLLTPGGTLVIGVPNLTSWQARFAGPLWFHLDVPRHLFHFSPTSLAAALDGAGLETREVSYLSLEHDPYGWVQSTLNRIGLQQNSLTRILMRLDKPSLSGLGLLLAGGALALPGLALAAASWLGASGALMTVKARHPASE